MVVDEKADKYFTESTDNAPTKLYRLLYSTYAAAVHTTQPQNVRNTEH